MHDPDQPDDSFLDMAYEDRFAIPDEPEDLEYRDSWDDADEEDDE